MLSIQTRLKALNETLKASAPESLVSLYENGVAELLDSAAGDGALRPGQEAPSFRLQSLDRRTIDLESLLESGPVVILFFRGTWCPFCQLQLSAMNEANSMFEREGGSLVAITPERPESMKEWVINSNLQFPVLHDPGAEIANRYGLVFTLGKKLQDLQQALGTPLAERTSGDPSQLPVPAVFVVAESGQISWRHVDRDYRLKRAEPSEVLSALRKACRNAEAT